MIDSLHWPPVLILCCPSRLWANSRCMASNLDHSYQTWVQTWFETFQTTWSICFSLPGLSGGWGLHFNWFHCKSQAQLSTAKEFETISNSTWTQVLFLLVSHQIDWLLNHCETLWCYWIAWEIESRLRGKTEGAFGSIVSPRLWVSVCGCFFSWQARA
jgi:hypothetical protein